MSYDLMPPLLTAPIGCLRNRLGVISSEVNLLAVGVVVALVLRPTVSREGCAGIGGKGGAFDL